MTHPLNCIGDGLKLCDGFGGNDGNGFGYTEGGYGNGNGWGGSPTGKYYDPSTE